jgi:hypothetical protein
VQAWSEARALEARSRTLADQIQVARRKYSQEFPELGRGAPGRPAEASALTEITTYVAALRSHCETCEEGLRRAIATSETQLLLAEIAKHTAGKLVPTDTLFSSPRRREHEAEAPAVPNSLEIDRQRRESEVMRILRRLSGHTPSDERKDLERLAAELVQLPNQGHAETLALELRLRVQRANERAEAAAWDAERAAVLRARLHGLEGDDVAAVTAALVRVEQHEQALTEALVRQAEEVERVARVREDQAYAAEVLREELTRLGYVVEEDFATLFVQGGQMYLHKPELKEFRVVMQIDPTASRMDARLARLGRAGESVSHQQRLRDQEMEEAWCHDFARLLAAVGKRQVAGRVVQRVLPGKKPVQVIEQADLERHRRRRAVSTLQRRL